MNWSCCVIVPVTSSINRSGRNCRGSGKYFGSKCDVVRNPITIVFFGIQYPAICTSSFVMCGNDMLAEIWKINHKQTSLIFIQYVMRERKSMQWLLYNIYQIYIYIYTWDLPIFEILCTSNSVASTYGNAFLSDKRTSRPNPTTCSKTEHCYDVILLQLPTTCWKMEHCYVVIRLINTRQPCQSQIIDTSSFYFIWRANR